MMTVTKFICHKKGRLLLMDDQVISYVQYLRTKELQLGIAIGKVMTVVYWLSMKGVLS